MAHSVSEAAARAVKNSERKQTETRTPAQRLADIRKNRAAKLFVTPADQDFLLASLDAALASVQSLTTIAEAAGKSLESTRADRDRFAHRVVELEAKVEEFRQVYEEENRSMALKVERIAGEGTEAPVVENI